MEWYLLIELYLLVLVLWLVGNASTLSLLDHTPSRRIEASCRWCFRYFIVGGVFCVVLLMMQAL